MECTLYLSDNCNMKCKYCYEGERVISGNMQLETLKLALKFIFDNNILDDRINMFYLGGEPLLNKELLYESINIIKSKYAKYESLINYFITTNGVFVTDQDIKFFEENNFDVSLSIDGTSDTHNINRESISGEDLYPIIMDNLKKFLSSGVNFTVRMTATPNNVEFLYNNVLYFYNLGVLKVNIGFDELAEWSNHSIDLLDRELELLDEYYINYIANGNDRILNIYDSKHPKMISREKAIYCSAGTSEHVIVNSKGDIFPCGYVSNNVDCKFGDVKKGLDSNLFYNFITNNIEPESSCKDCEISFTCCGAKCGFMNYVITGKLNINSKNTCLVQKCLYRHNLKVLKEMYNDNNPRLMNMLVNAESCGIDLSPFLSDISKDTLND